MESCSEPCHASTQVSHPFLLWRWILIIDSKVAYKFIYMVHVSAVSKDFSSVWVLSFASKIIQRFCESVTERGSCGSQEQYDDCLCLPGGRISSLVLWFVSSTLYRYLERPYNWTSQLVAVSSINNRLVPCFFRILSTVVLPQPFICYLVRNIT